VQPGRKIEADAPAVPTREEKMYADAKRDALAVLDDIRARIERHGAGKSKTFAMCGDLTHVLHSLGQTRNTLPSCVAHDMVLSHGWRDVGEALEALVDDRSHGDEYVAEVAREVFNEHNRNRHTLGFRASTNVAEYVSEVYQRAGKL
jgi:hypothetical protein